MKPALRAAAAWLAGLHAAVAGAALPTVAAPAAAPPSAGAGLLQAGFGLLVVLALVFACAWAVKRLGLPAVGGGGRLLKVVASTAVGQRERVVVVEVGGQWLVLGVAAGGVRHLQTMPAGTPAAQAGPVAETPPSFEAAFAQKLRATLDSLKGKA